MVRGVKYETAGLCLSSQTESVKYYSNPARFDVFTSSCCKSNSYLFATYDGFFGGNIFSDRVGK